MDLNDVIDKLLDTPYACRKGDEYVYVRCPICGDSVKHRDKPHCNIWIKPLQPLIYHCWICEESGIVDREFLDLLGINDTDITNKVSQYNKAASRTERGKKFTGKSKNKEVYIPKIQDTSISRMKLEYMRNRLGLPFDYNMMEALRVIFSLKDFLVINNLPVNNKFANVLGYLERDYVGFLSSTKDVITFRSISKDAKIRYVKYFIYEGKVDNNQMYAIPIKGVDIFNKNMNLNICEGTFDALGVFFHVKKANLKDNIYCAVCGSAYPKVLQYWLKKGFLSNLIVNIYSDSDKDIYFYKKLIDEYSIWVKEFHVFYNRIYDSKGKSDYGVPKEMIDVKEMMLRW